MESNESLVAALVAVAASNLLSDHSLFPVLPEANRNVSVEALQSRQAKRAVELAAEMHQHALLLLKK